MICIDRNILSGSPKPSAQAIAPVLSAGHTVGGQRMWAAAPCGCRSWLLAPWLLLRVYMAPCTARARSARPAGRPAWLLAAAVKGFAARQSHMHLILSTGTHTMKESHSKQTTHTRSSPRSCGKHWLSDGSRDPLAATSHAKTLNLDQPQWPPCSDLPAVNSLCVTARLTTHLRYKEHWQQHHIALGTCCHIHM